MFIQYYQKKLESVLEEKPEENGDAFDREAYLRNVEEFEDVEIVVPGRTVSKINRKHVSNNQALLITCLYIWIK